EHLDNRLAAEAIQLVRAEDALRVARHELVQPGLVLHQLLDTRHLPQRPGHLADRSGEAEPTCHGLADRTVPEVQHHTGGEAAAAEVGVLGPLYLKLPPFEAGPEVDVRAE